MIVDYYDYAVLESRVSPIAFKENAPMWIRRELLEGTGFSYTIAIDASNLAGMRVMEGYLEDNWHGQWYRTRKLEISRSEMGRYSHFFISVQGYNQGGLDIDGYPIRGDVYFRGTPPKCSFDNCYWGADCGEPFEVTPKLLKKLKRLGIGRVLGWWKTDMFVLSPEMKGLLESNLISGFSYEPCILRNAALKTPGAVAFIARPEASVVSRASYISIGENVCPEHRYITASRPVRERFMRRDMASMSLQVVGGVYSELEGLAYRYRQGPLIVTREALQVMLNNKVSGLSRMTSHLKEKFLPVIMEDESEGHAPI